MNGLPSYLSGAWQHPPAYLADARTYMIDRHAAAEIATVCFDAGCTELAPVVLLIERATVATIGRSTRCQ